MEEPLSEGISPSRESNNSLDTDSTNPRMAASLEMVSKGSLNSFRTPTTKKAKRVRFFRNGDKFYTGVVMAVTPERYRNFDSLASDLTRAIAINVTLPNGVRSIFTMDGKKVDNIGDLEDGKCYVVSSQGEIFKKVEYSASKVRRGSSLSGLPQSPAGTGRQISPIPAFVKARIVTLIRNGSKPRKIVRLLLNKRNSPSIEHVFEAITEVVKLDSGAVRRVYTLAGKPVISLEQFFESEEVFIAYGQEKSTQEDFELDNEESKTVQNYRRVPGISNKRSACTFMPKRSGRRDRRTTKAPQVRTPSPLAPMLPQPLGFQYAVGHVIGDGNFAVVRHCIHKASGAEYAIKIVDKYKCHGKGIMLANEVAILRQVCHPNIISLIAEQETDEQLFLVMELVKGGDLFDAIAAATKFSEAEASVMISHLTSALAYLHSHQIVHRDVKPENLLVELEGSQVRCLKLGDFGLAQVVREPLYTVCGTPTYVAPEILQETGYGLKVDVWAAGVILYIMLCGYPPFCTTDNDQEELFERILNGQYKFHVHYWDTISVLAKQLIANMLQPQPELRFSAEDVLDHPWLVSFLGGDQAVSGGGGALKSSQQHRDQQCQPLRLATFEFDYKKQRRYDVVDGGETPRNSNDLGMKPRGEQWQENTTERETYRARKPEEICTSDEVDNTNGNTNCEEPLSLSTDCLRDIRDLTSSLHDLVVNIDNNCSSDNNIAKRDPRESPASSVSSNLDRTTRNVSNSSRRCESPLSSSYKHSVNHKNGNSLTNIHSSPKSAPKSQEESGNANERRIETPKTAKRLIDRTGRTRRTNLCKIENFTRDGSNGSSSNELDPRKFGNSSTERLSTSENSDNNIETSDSFVNIKFAKHSRRGNGSTSSQSVQSSDSIENTRFSRDSSGENKLRRSDEVVHREIPRRAENDRRKSIGTGNRQIKQPIDYAPSKISRPSMIPIQNNGQTRNTIKSVELSRIPVNNGVKLREKKNVAGTTSVTPLRKPMARSSIENGRKYNSTDELREEHQKPNVKAKRFSLYYTPQPARKTYETDNRNSRIASGRADSARSRPTSWKMPETSKKISEEISRVDPKDSTKNRKSVVDLSTVASRSKSSRQTLHTRNSNFTPGRTK